jgi:hypothetical protein
MKPHAMDVHASRTVAALYNLQLYTTCWTQGNTDCCMLPVLMSARFFQVLHTLNVAEGYRAGEQRNILQVRS